MGRSASEVLTCLRQVGTAMISHPSLRLRSSGLTQNVMRGTRWLSLPVPAPPFPIPSHPQPYVRRLMFCVVYVALPYVLTSRPARFPCPPVPPPPPACPRVPLPGNAVSCAHDAFVCWMDRIGSDRICVTTPWNAVFQLGRAGEVHRRRQRGDRSVPEEGGSRQGHARRGIPGSDRGGQPGTVSLYPCTGEEYSLCRRPRKNTW